METVLQITRIIHIAAGFTAFIGAPIALATVKGGYYHRLFGKIFFWAMTLVSATAFFNAFMRNNWFLFFLSVFTFYLAASGYRALYRKKVKVPEDIAKVDWALTGLNGLFSLGLVGVAAFITIKYGVQAFGVISFAFGAIGLRASFLDIRKFSKPVVRKSQWLEDHIVGMFAAYIAAWSAFSATNMNFLPTVIQWLWPTIVGVPMMIYLIRKYAPKPKVA